MPRIRLAIREQSRKTIADPFGVKQDIVHVRLFTRVALGTDATPRDAIVDSGAPVSQFPLGKWELLTRSEESPGPLTIIPQHHTLPLNKLPLYSIAGCTYRAKYGWIEVLPVDAMDDSIRLARSWVFAALFVARVEYSKTATEWIQREEDDKGLKDIVMGVGCGILDGRYLIVSPHPETNRREAWIQDEKPIEPAITESECSSRIPPLA